MKDTSLDIARYQAAEQLLGHRRDELVLGGSVRPWWVDGSRFWFRTRTADGVRFRFADPLAGTVRDAFDHDRLAKALSAATGSELDAAALPVLNLRPATDRIALDTPGGTWELCPDTYDVRAGDPPPHDPLQVVSPDGRQAVYRDGCDLWLRDLASGTVRALTSDGTPEADYGANPDYLMHSTLFDKIGLPTLPPAVAWSSDGRRLLTHRTRQACLRSAHLLDPGPSGQRGPTVVTQRAAMPGDDDVPLAEWVIIDVGSGAVLPAATELVPMPVMSPLMQGWAWWGEDGSRAWVLARTRDARSLSLLEIDAVTGATRTVVTESGPTRVEPAQGEFQPPIVRVCPEDGSVLWFSQRDGWGHLYRIGLADGAVRNQVTVGAWLVQRILDVDTGTGVVRFVASGMVAEDPARRTVCSVGLDGADLTVVTDDDLDHDVTVAPDRSYFLTSASTVIDAPTVTARAWDGSTLLTVTRADVSRLRAAGWRPPEPFTAIAEDGTTVLHGLLYHPHGFDPAHRYPVIDTPAGLPGAARVRGSFDPGHDGVEAEVLAALGFAVVAIDGRGAPGRSKAFHDESYGALGTGCGLADHVAALRQVAAMRPWLDLGRVGIVGTSGGGYAAVRALIDHPDVFSVAVAEAGMYDFRELNPGLAEAYQGPLDSPEAEAGYLAASVIERAAEVTGRLLVVHGGLDDRAPAHLALRLVERMIGADRDVELLYVPRGDHILFGYEHHVTRRRWDFLVRSLLEVHPPAYRLAARPFDAAMLAGLFS